MISAAVASTLFALAGTAFAQSSVAELVAELRGAPTSVRQYILDFLDRLTKALNLG